MALVVPSWFKGRQGKAEPAGENAYRLTGPNVLEGVIAIRQGDNCCWSASLRRGPEGPDVAATEPEFSNTYDAWEAAFELFRVHCIV